MRSMHAQRVCAPVCGIVWSHMHNMPISCSLSHPIWCAFFVFREGGAVLVARMCALMGEAAKGGAGEGGLGSSSSIVNILL